MSRPFKIFLVCLGLLLCFGSFVTKSVRRPTKAITHLDRRQWETLARDQAISRIHVDGKGAIDLDGKPTSIDQLKSSLKTLKDNAGAVVFTQDHPSDQNAKQAADVLNLVASLKLPVKMSELK